MQLLYECFFLSVLYISANCNPVMNGWRIYVHGESGKENKLLDLLECHGAKIQVFFSKNIAHCVINRTEMSAKVKSVALNDRQFMTRGQQMLIKRRVSEKKISVIDQCKKWNVKVMGWECIKRIFFDLCKSCVVVQRDIGRKSSALRGKSQEEKVVTTWVRRLKSPFIKVEDQSGKYRPLVREFRRWPVINFDSHHHGCPFDDSSDDEHDHKIQKTKSLQNKGYCECCRVHFENYNLHLKSKQHTDLARNPDNYKELDTLIAKYPFERFLDDIKEKYENRDKFR